MHASRSGGIRSAPVLNRLTLTSATRLVSALCLALPGMLQPASQAQTSLDGLLEPVRSRHGLPALAAAVVVRGEVVALGAVGSRRNDARIPVTVDDRFHLGSCTKAMTAVMAAIAVERGLLRWGSTLAELFPEHRAAMSEAMGSVTVRQLLSHSSGINDASLIAALSRQAAELSDDNLDGQRAKLAALFLRQPLSSPPGSRFEYSNINYILVGTILERLQKRSWEELIQEQLFAPLALTGAGLGPQSSLGLTDAPLGHQREGGKLRPMLAGPNADNPLVIGPAGVAHMSLLGAARWASWNAAQGRRGPALVSAASLQLLHTAVIATDPDQPAGDRYALGWLVVQPPWASGALLMHAGSNTKNLAHLWVDPRRDLALVLLTNVAGPKADEALSELAPLLNRQFAASAAAPPD